MKLFDKRGMLIIPNPIKEEVAKAPKAIVAKELYCQNGHSLISNRAMFNGHPGVLLKVKTDHNFGLIALSPVYGEKNRIFLDINLESGKILKILCPTCGIELPVYSQCSCGADLISLFMDREFHFNKCIGICNRVDCHHAQIINSGELISQTMVDMLRYH